MLILPPAFAFHNNKNYFILWTRLRLDSPAKLFIEWNISHWWLCDNQFFNTAKFKSLSNNAIAGCTDARNRMQFNKLCAMLIDKLIWTSQLYICTTCGMVWLAGRTVVMAWCYQLNIKMHFTMTIYKVAFFLLCRLWSLSRTNSNYRVNLCDNNLFQNY